MPETPQEVPPILQQLFDFILNSITMNLTINSTDLLEINDKGDIVEYVYRTNIMIPSTKWAEFREKLKFVLSPPVKGFKPEYIESKEIYRGALFREVIFRVGYRKTR